MTVLPHDHQFFFSYNCNTAKLGRRNVLLVTTLVYEKPMKNSLSPCSLLLLSLLLSGHQALLKTIKGAVTRTYSRSGTRLNNVENPFILVDASYNLAIGMSTAGIGCGIHALSKKDRIRIVPAVGSAIMLFLASYLQTKTESVRFRFDNEAFSIVKADGNPIGDNPVMGGSYRWIYNDIVEYKVFPSDVVPLLLYFKETQTPEDKRVAAPITVSATAGQRCVLCVYMMIIQIY